jgi:hypothetical protein
LRKIWNWFLGCSSNFYTWSFQNIVDILHR